MPIKPWDQFSNLLFIEVKCPFLSTIILLLYLHQCKFQIYNLPDIGCFSNENRQSSIRRSKLMMTWKKQ